MVYTIEEIKERIRPVAEKYNLPAVYLFGSYARGEADEKSDIDIMIDRTGAKVKTLWDLGGVFGDLEDCFQKEIDLITTFGLNDSNDTRFKNNVEHEKVRVYAR
jgi:predicted nucleotidyltransferase